MRKLLMASALALSLAGCAGTPAGDLLAKVTPFVTVGVSNPVTSQMLFDAEASLNVGVQALVQYRRACLRGQVDTNCRANIRAIQVYTRKIPPLLKNARAFVRQNDQVNARIAYNSLIQTISDFKAEAASRGVR